MVNSIKPVVTIIENDEWQLLILGITLLIFLTVLLYFTRYYYKKNYQVTTTTNPQTVQETHAVTPGVLKPCKPGECLVNISSGLKKCPEKELSTLFYDSETQVCSPKGSCPTQVPYAFNGDGSVNRYGTCENSNQACSCTSEITCPVYFVSKFSVVNGNIYSSYASEKNFLLEQVPYSSSDSYKNSIKLNNQGEFCKINSTYSNQLTGGCSFLNQTNDFLMKCDKESLDPTISVSPYSLNPYYLSTNGNDENKQFCEIQPYLDSNWNNMTLCVNQNPCKLGNYTYNFDQYRKISTTTTVNGQSTTTSAVNTAVENSQLNSRNFCQAYASDITTYLTDLQFYTLSCIKGTQCNILPDVEDDGKFFSGNTSELDISAINASYPVLFNTTTNKLQYKPATIDIDYSYNPIRNQVKSGDLVSVEYGLKFQVVGSKTGFQIGTCQVTYGSTSLNGRITSVLCDPARGDYGIIGGLEIGGNITDVIPDSSTTVTITQYSATINSGSNFKVGFCTIIDSQKIQYDGQIMSVMTDPALNVFGVIGTIISSTFDFSNLNLNLNEIIQEQGYDGSKASWEPPNVSNGQKFTDNTFSITKTKTPVYYIIRVNPLTKEISFYDFYGHQSVPYGPYIELYKEALTNINIDTQVTYYPQYALNGYNYNTISTNNSNLNEEFYVNNTATTGNIGYSFKIGNVNKTESPADTVLGGGYNPSYSIVNTNNFFRGGLSKPRGYVYKEFIESEAVTTDLANSQKPVDFNDGDYKIKETPFNTKFYNDISFYNPVWNNQYGRTECIRCNPLLVASINMAQVSSSGSASGFIYDAVTIQFSGKDFGHYRKNFLETTIDNIWCFESKANLNVAKNSSVLNIYLDRPNQNIKIGDFILSSENKFPFSIKPIGTIDASKNGTTFYIFIGNVYQTVNGAVNFTPFQDFGTTKYSVPNPDTWEDKDFFGLGIDNNTFQDFNPNQYIKTIYNSTTEAFDIVEITSSILSIEGAFFFGNKYTGINVDGEFVSPVPIISAINTLANTIFVDVAIVPIVQVASNKNGVITTTGYKQSTIFGKTNLSTNENLQFISLSRNLYLDTLSINPNEPLPGSGGKIQIQEITDGRITSIKVIAPGSGYSNTSPNVTLKSYDPYLN